jgi:Undecaprenyl-phosphate glucose phosphotransferase
MNSRLVDQQVLKRLVKALDLVALGFIGLVLTFRLTNQDDALQAATGSLLVLVLVLSTMLSMRAMDQYEPSSWRKIRKTILKSAMLAAACGVAAYMASQIMPVALTVTWVLQWSLTTTAFLIASRLPLGIWTERTFAKGKLHRRIAIVGGGPAADKTLELLQIDHRAEFDVVGLFDDRFDDRSPDVVGPHRKLGSITELSEFARSNRIDIIIVAIPMSAEKRLMTILKQLWELPVDIRISAATTELRFSANTYSFLGKLPLLTVFDRPLSGWDQFLKSCLDRMAAAMLILLLAPVLALVALAVKLDSPGPVIFRQKRFGFNNEIINVLKFRSLYANQSDAKAAKLVTKNDPRVTRVGRYIRKSSLDELPQLFNVLKGELSLVGPRPHATGAHALGTLYEQVVDSYFARHKVKPGITGWAQINGWRGETDTFEKVQNRVKYDLDYIDRWSLGLDVYILLKTPLSLLKTENAY